MQTLALSLYLLFSDAESKIAFWALFDLELKVVSTLFLDSVFNGQNWPYNYSQAQYSHFSGTKMLR